MRGFRKGFGLGRLCATRGVAHDMERDAAFARFVAGSLARYRCCDWGDVSAADGKIELDAAYRYPGHGSRKIWILTEADRSVTTVLYPEEY